MKHKCVSLEETSSTQGQLQSRENFALNNVISEF